MTSYQKMNPPKHIRALGPLKVWSLLDPLQLGYTTRQKYIETMKSLARGGNGVSSGVPASPVATGGYSASHAPTQTIRSAMVTIGRF